ncbi:MAG: hypothetical protein R2731_17900 [Nocardioides sp.]
MSKALSTAERRRRAAAQALANLDGSRSDHQLVSLQCPHGHHVAAVVATPAGLVYVTRIGPHGHGSRDFVDTGHHGARGGDEYADLLAPSREAAAELPAWCDCGPRTLSRDEVAGYAGSGQRTVHLT